MKWEVANKRDHPRPRWSLGLLLSGWLMAPEEQHKTPSITCAVVTIKQKRTHRACAWEAACPSLQAIRSQKHRGVCQQKTQTIIKKKIRTKTESVSTSNKQSISPDCSYGGPGNCWSHLLPLLHWHTPNQSTFTAATSFVRHSNLRLRRHTPISIHQAAMVWLSRDMRWQVIAARAAN